MSAGALPVPLEPTALTGRHDGPIHGGLTNGQVTGNPFVHLVAVIFGKLLMFETGPRRLPG